MRGLTAEERALLAELCDPTPAVEVSEFTDVHQALVARGAARWYTTDEDDGWTYEHIEGTPLGELALRVDAAARCWGGGIRVNPAALALYVFSLMVWKFPPGKHPEVETREAGAERYAVIARAEADSARQFGDRWPEGSTDLALAGVSAFGWSMGFRRDVQVGAKRGPAGEACFSDMQPATLRRFAQFETADLTDEQLAQKVVGLDYASLRRCFDAGFAGLVHVRAVARWKCKRDPLKGTFALYATGTECVTANKIFGVGGIERARVKTLFSLRGRVTTHFPDWVPAELTGEPASDERVSEVLQ